MTIDPSHAATVSVYYGAAALIAVAVLFYIAIRSDYRPRD